MTKKELRELAQTIRKSLPGTEAEKELRKLTGDPNVDKCIIVSVDGGVANVDHLPDGFSWILVDWDDITGGV